MACRRRVSRHGKINRLLHVGVVGVVSVRADELVVVPEYSAYDGPHRIDRAFAVEI